MVMEQRIESLKVEQWKLDEERKGFILLKERGLNEITNDGEAWG